MTHGPRRCARFSAPFRLPALAPKPPVTPASNPTQAPRLTTRARRSFRSFGQSRWSSVLGGVLVGLLLLVATVPVVLLDVGRRRARRCLARIDAPETTRLPACDAHASWFALPAKVPWTARWTSLLTEELSARMAVARYVDAAVGTPDRELLPRRWAALREAAQAVEEGSGRLRLGQLGSAIPAPEPGALAFSVGDQQTLVKHGLDWTQWYTSKRAIEIALLRGQLGRAQRLAEHYAGRPDTDLRLMIGALLCTAGQADRGMEHARSVERARADKRNANMARHFGAARVLVEACAAQAGAEPPRVPSYGGAGEWDHRARLAAMRLRLAQLEPGCDRPDDLGGCEHTERLTEAANGAVRWLDSRIAMEFRLELVAAVAPFLPSSTMARELIRPLPDEPGPLAGLPLTVHRMMARGSPARPFVSSKQLLAAADHLLALEPVSPEQQALAGAMIAHAATALAGLGEAEQALAQARRGADLALDDELGRALLVSSVAHLAGQTRAGVDALRASLDGDRAPDALLAAAHLQLSELLASAGRRAEALTAARRGAEVARSAAVPYLNERAQWLLLALESLSSSAAPTRTGWAAVPKMPMLGPHTTWVPAEARAATTSRAVEVWRTWLAAAGPTRRACRYEAFRSRGDAPDGPTAHLVLAGLLADEPAEVEPWLDAFYAIDGGHTRLRSYAWSRTEAARWRGDATATAIWLARYRALEQWAQQPTTAELFQELRL